MLKLIIPGDDFFDEITQEFITRGDVSLELEHSLVSLSKWESKFEKPFLGVGEKTTEEILAYIEAMILSPDFPPEVLSRLTSDNYDTINEYLNAKQTATWFSETNEKRSTEAITSELIYYWMFAQKIPIECETWPLNRLFTLLRVFDVKNSKPKEMNRSSMMEQRRQLNEQRKRKLGTRG